MALSKTAEKKLFGVAMRLAAEKGWRRFSMSDLAEEAGISLVDLHEVYGSKSGILSAFTRYIDRQVLSGTPPPEPDPAVEESARDRLFDVLMRRFDALQPYKDGLRQIANEAGGDGVVGALCAGARLLQSMTWMLEAAGIGTGGLAGRLRAKGLAAVYLSTMRVWFRDETVDKSQTMARLDRGLAQAERFANMRGPFGSGRRRGSASEPPPEGEPEPV